MYLFIFLFYVLIIYFVCQLSPGCSLIGFCNQAFSCSFRQHLPVHTNSAVAVKLLIVSNGDGCCG